MKKQQQPFLSAHKQLLEVKWDVVGNDVQYVLYEALICFTPCKIRCILCPKHFLETLVLSHHASILLLLSTFYSVGCFYFESLKFTRQAAGYILT